MSIKEQLFKNVFNVNDPDKLIKPVSRVVLVQIYKTEEKTKSGFDLPQSLIQGTKFDNRMGRVLDIGPHSYDDLEFYPSGNLCEIGDWVIYWRHDASFLTLKGVDCAFLPANKILATTGMPEEIITAYHLGK